MDLLDLMFADLLGQNYMEHLGNFDYFLGLCITDGQFANFFCAFLEISIFSSNKGGNRWIIDKTVDLWNIPDISRESTQAKLTHTKDELFNQS